MPLFDLSLDELRRYRADEAAPPDFEEFWAGTLTQAREHDLALTRSAVTGPLRLVEVEDVSFAGFGGSPIKAWLIRPAGSTGPLPTVVELNGYGGGRGLPHERLAWACAGYSYLFMDTRGQGSGWGSGGSTPDPEGSDPAHPGFMTRGVLSPQTSYFRRLITDAVRAVDAALAMPDAVDADRIAVAGTSQGGGLALAVAGLVPQLRAVMADVPFLCHIRRGVELAGNPYAEVARYLAVHRGHVDQVFATLAYMDGMHFAARIQAPALVSVALMDQTCPPSTVFAAYNALTGPKEIDVYPFNNHEGGQGHQQAKQLGWLGEQLASPR